MRIVLESWTAATSQMAGHTPGEILDGEVIDLHPSGQTSEPRVDVEVELRRFQPRLDQTEEETKRNKRKFFNRVLKMLKKRLISHGDVAVLINQFQRDANEGSPAPSDLDGLFICMKTKGLLKDLIVLQYYLFNAHFSGICNELADMAKSACICKEAVIDHFSLAIPDDEELDSDEVLIKVFIANNELRYLSDLRGNLDRMFPEYAGEISVVCLERSYSIWVTMVAPQAAAEKWKRKIREPAFRDCLHAWGISKLKFVKKEVKDTKETFEPVPKKPKLDPPSETASAAAKISSAAQKNDNDEEHQWTHWDKIDVLRYFNECCLPKAVIALDKLEFTGRDVAFWSVLSLKEKGVKEDIAKLVMEEVAKVKEKRDSITFKLIQDSVHGPMDFHPLCVKIMDTPEFQRLRNIKQLGSVYLVYPGAAHNRFEHSLGVGFLTNRFVKSLQQRQPELGINDIDMLCTTIAGLCHDLGQGPHSNLFKQFMHAVAEETNWQQEDSAYIMFDCLIEANELIPEMYLYGLTERDIQFIREQIHGKRGKKEEYKGRGEEKSFLYEIVAQRQNGIDVNKWDYIARDSLMLGMSSSFDHRRFVMHARVIKKDGEFRICARDKDADDHYKMFQTRYSLGRRAYFHKVHQSIEAMLLDVLVCVNKSASITYTTGDREEVRISETVKNPVAFTKLTDSIFDMVELSKSKDLQEAREILKNIRLRRLYTKVSETEPTHRDVSTAKLVKSIEAQKPGIRAVVKRAYLDYGLKEKDPIEGMLFYRKGDPKTAVQLSKAQVSSILPEKFAECVFRIYCKDTDEHSRKECAHVFNTCSGDEGLTVRLQKH